MMMQVCYIIKENCKPYSFIIDFQQTYNVEKCYKYALEVWTGDLVSILVCTMLSSYPVSHYIKCYKIMLLYGDCMHLNLTHVAYKEANMCMNVQSSPHSLIKKVSLKRRNKILYTSCDWYYMHIGSVVLAHSPSLTFKMAVQVKLGPLWRHMKNHCSWGSQPVLSIPP